LEESSLANKHAAEKAIRNSLRRRTRNRVVRSSARTHVKQAASVLSSGNATESAQAIRDAVRALDKAAQKGVIKKNNAARRKSRLMKKLNQSRSSTPK
jgi:small subunit ribosomal protein S20